MAEMKWYKRNPMAALDGMMMLSLEERGAYNTMLDLIYANGGRVIDDERFLSGWMRCDVRIWKRIRGRLIDLGKLYIEDGYVRNKVSDKEVADASCRIDAAREAGAASAAKRKEKYSKNNDVTSTHVERNHQPYTLTSTVTEEEAKAPSSPQTPKHDDRDALLFKYVMPDGTLLSFEGFFERMWLLYPNLRDRGHKGKARDQMLKKLNEGVTYETIGRGVSKYRDYCQATGELQPDFFRWLRDDGFTRPYDIPAEHRNKPRGADRGAIIEQQTKAALIESAQRLGLIDG